MPTNWESHEQALRDTIHRLIDETSSEDLVIMLGNVLNEIKEGDRRIDLLKVAVYAASQVQL